jgi:hypothetical protein
MEIKHEASLVKPVSSVFEGSEGLNSLQPPPMSVSELAKKLEEVDPRGKETLKSAREMFEQ